MMIEEEEEEKTMRASSMERARKGLIFFYFFLIFKLYNKSNEYKSIYIINHSLIYILLSLIFF